MLTETERLSLEEIRRDKLEHSRLERESAPMSHLRKFDELCEKYFVTETGSGEAVALVRKIREAFEKATPMHLGERSEPERPVD